MNFLLWTAVSFFIIGFSVLALLKRKRNHRMEPTIWFILGTTAWGVTSIMLFAWWFTTI
ncbi:hypothetical protein [Rossellomorea sp. YZS02]|uniref:hypothetical protein n=1 Tax=Rossellomorea sp. YZS02 TaxID=3097358 RepID=UPI002A13377C|nr:hypothetical protein [Rossellomorea sp. YZS02]MDX8344510.1 hypothetical protein [Rossellomorea sp. YZS02]